MYWSGPWLPGEAAPERWEHLSAAPSPSGACTQFHQHCLQAVPQGLTSRPPQAPLAPGRRRLGWAVSPSLEGRQSGDNDRQVDLVVVLCCPSGSGLCPFSPLQEWKREGGRGSLCPLLANTTCPCTGAQEQLASSIPCALTSFGTHWRPGNGRRGFLSRS